MTSLRGFVSGPHERENWSTCSRVPLEQLGDDVEALQARGLVTIDTDDCVTLTPDGLKAAKREALAERSAFRQKTL